MCGKFLESNQRLTRVELAQVPHSQHLGLHSHVAIICNCDESCCFLNALRMGVANRIKQDPSCGIVALGNCFFQMRVSGGQDIVVLVCRCFSVLGVGTVFGMRYETVLNVHCHDLCECLRIRSGKFGQASDSMVMVVAFRLKQGDKGL